MDCSLSGGEGWGYTSMKKKHWAKTWGHKIAHSLRRHTYYCQGQYPPGALLFSFKWILIFTRLSEDIPGCSYSDLSNKAPHTSHSTCPYRSGPLHIVNQQVFLASSPYLQQGKAQVMEEYIPVRMWSSLVSKCHFQHEPVSINHFSVYEVSFQDLYMGNTS